jgi:hypothetical protein
MLGPDQHDNPSTNQILLSPLRQSGQKEASLSGSDPDSRCEPALTQERESPMIPLPEWGRTGFDLTKTPEAACRGRFVGLVNHRTKQIS